jgi:RimJ/RimL family protein N-acetyltransferase
MKLTIKCKNFTLRPYRKSDAKSLAKNINDRTISRNMSRVPYPYTLKMAKKFIKESIVGYRKRKPTRINLAIDIGGEVAGGIIIAKIELGHRAGIGYWLAAQYRGKGIMTRVVKEMVKFGFNKFKLKRIEAKVFLFNKKSAKVLERAGFQLEGILRKNTKKGKQYLDTYLYAKVK